MIIIFKFELEGHSELTHQIRNLTQETAQIGNACVYVPKTGKVDELVSLLQRHQIRFGLHQSDGLVKKQVHEN